MMGFAFGIGLRQRVSTDDAAQSNLECGFYALEDNAQRLYG